MYIVKLYYCDVAEVIADYEVKYEKAKASSKQQALDYKH